MYKIFKKYGIEYGYVLLDIIPSPAEQSGKNSYKKKRRLRTYLRKLSDSFLPSVIASIVKRMPPALLGVRSAYACIVSGSDYNAVMANLLCSKSTLIINVPSLNFSECLFKYRHNEKIIDYPYFLFIDQGLPLHPDGVTHNIKIPKEKYYGEIRKLLNKLENETGLKAIIAAHPRVDYLKHPDCYENYPVFYGETPGLTMNAHFVLLHMSGSISYITFFSKPVLVVTTDEMQPYYSEIIKTFADELGANIINASQDIYGGETTVSNFITCDKGKYDNYIRNRMYKEYKGAMGSEQKDTWGSFIEAVRQ
jgi:hypothetical protein